MCYIEMIGNPIEVFEKNEMESEKERLGLQSFWAWEHKILKQEQEYFHNLIQSLDAQVQLELESVLTSSVSGQTEEVAGTAADHFNSALRKEVEVKFAKKRTFLQAGLRRAQFEESIHLKQEKYNRYERLFENYAFPAHEYVINDTVSKSSRITA